VGRAKRVDASMQLSAAVRQHSLLLLLLLEQVGVTRTSVPLQATGVNALTCARVIPRELCGTATRVLSSRQETLTDWEGVMHRRPQLRIAGNGHILRLVGDWESAPLDGLCELAGLAHSLDKLQRQLVLQARSAGRSWTEIGDALGVSKQSAWQRFSSPPD